MFLPLTLCFSTTKSISGITETKYSMYTKEESLIWNKKQELKSVSI